MMWSSWRYDEHPAFERGPGGGGLPDDEGTRFVRVLARTTRIARHPDLLAWLRTEVQMFLPHQVLIGAWGDFSRWNVKCEVLASLPGAPLASPGCQALDALLREAHAQWVRGGREPLLLEAAAAALPCASCGCALHRALAGMPARLVHGVRDKRSGCDSLYIALDRAGFAAARGRPRFASLAHVLVCQMDVVWRRLAGLRLDDLPAPDLAAAAGAPALSAREQEVLGRLSRGSTNGDIAEALGISLFTVKNHLKRIFRKIGVTNRTQAAARYNEALAQFARDAAH
jgi:transcriptional regulator EpsA